MSAEFGREMRRIGANVDSGLAGLGKVAAARIGPKNDRHADGFGFFSQLAELFYHLELIFRAWVDREADRCATEPQCIADACMDGLVHIRRVAV